MKEKRKIKIGFVGGGNMGEALIKALLQKKIFRPHEIGFHETDSARQRNLKRKYRIASFATNPDLASSSSTLLLAIKPQQMAPVLEEIRPFLRKDLLVISIAAGIDTPFLQKRLSPGTRIIRVMPNLCVTVGEGAAAICPGETAKRQDLTLTMKIFSSAGKAVLVEQEDWLDLVTAVSGSGPAFVFLFLEALIEAGEKLGLPAALGKTLALQTLKGAGAMVAADREPIAALIEKVASKGGTTEAGLKVLAEGRFKEIIGETISAAARRAKELRCIS